MAGFDHAPVCQPEAAMFISCGLLIKRIRNQ